ncbi:MAG TPA: sn-glycerol-3-phosphate import ATP-binding protein UgpC [Stellaceae bacterium]|jgi:sn-glycerol 3-phosphate transport system ATP-binding protein|nr:sn-glycerol-3-phosphate import ATP-binding protein UgpC [Stellaceae bacterium]
MATVTLDNLRKSYGEREVVHGVSCAVADGELVVVVGPSGCGKSTLLRMVAGLETISAGSVAIDGRIVNGVEPKDRDIAMVFQNYALYPHMSVFNNMAYGLRVRRMSRPDIKARVEHAAAILQLDGLLDRKPRQLSGGQRQRVAMGRAIVRDPKVFLFDEPLSNLDAQLRVQMRVEIKQLQQELGTTSLYVTHDQVEAMTLADRLIVMNAGNTDQIGPPIDLYERPATIFVAGFIGSPAMNLIPARLVAGSVVIGDIVLPFNGNSGDAAGRAVTIGLRPEHLDLAGDGPIEIRVELLERLGADTMLHGRLPDGTRLIARAPGTLALSLGETVRLTIRPKHIHLFDVQTGRRLDRVAGRGLF